jgi:SAM-dependent methyltransferase
MASPEGHVAEPSKERSSSLVAFVHIPKTAGGTVKSVFGASEKCAATAFGGRFIRDPEQELPRLKKKLSKGVAGPPRRKRWRVLIGHIPYGVFEAHLPSDTRYMTFLREPVSLVLSRYYRHSNYTISLEEALERGLPIGNDERSIRIPMDNLMTRFLSGHPSPFDRLEPNALDDAKANLRDFAFVGITERFDESIALLERVLGLGHVPYQRQHINPRRAALDETSADQLSLIESRNSFDAELYDFGRQLFEEAVAGADEGFGGDVEELRRLSENVPAMKGGVPLRRGRLWGDSGQQTTAAPPARRRQVVKKTWRDEAPPPGDVEEMRDVVAPINARAAVPIEVAGVEQLDGGNEGGVLGQAREPFLKEEHHRQYGRPWAMGKYVFEFAVAAGLLPQHRLLDFGCGALRLGNWAIPYLEAGNYFGVDNHLGSLEAATTYEIPLHGLEGKRPRLLWNDDFAFSHFGTTFDYVIDFSGSSAVAGVRLVQLFRRFADVLKPGGRLLIGRGRVPPPKIRVETLEGFHLTLVRGEVVQRCPLLEKGEQHDRTDNVWWEFVRA